MPVTPTGTAVFIQSSAQSGSQLITIPSDADFVAVGVSIFKFSNNWFPANPLTLGGVNLTTIQKTDEQQANGQAWIGYAKTSDTGTGSKSLAWNWGAAFDEGAQYSVTFWKAVDTTNPITSSGQQLTADTDLTGLTAGANDVTIGVMYSYTSITSVNDNSQTQVELRGVYNSGAALGVAYKQGATGFFYTGGSFQTVVAMVIKAGATGIDVSGAGGIASAEAFGTPVISVNQAPSGIASNETFGTQSIQASLTGINGIASAEALGTPTIGGSVAPAGITSGEALGTPTLSVNISNAGAIASGEAFGNPSIQANLATSGGWMWTGEVFGTPTISVAVAAVGITGQETIGTPALSVNIAGGAGNIASGEAFGNANVSTISPIDLTNVGAIVSAEAFGTPTISVTVAAVDIASQEAIGTPALSVNIASAGNIASGEAFGNANVSTTAPVNLTNVGAIVSGEAFGTPTISVAVATLGITGQETIGTPALSMNIAGAGNIASGEAFGNANITTTSPINVSNAGAIISAEAFGVPTLVAWLEPAGVASDDLFGAPTLVVTITPVGIASREVFGFAIVGDAIVTYEPVLKTSRHDQLVGRKDNQIAGLKTRNLR